MRNKTKRKESGITLIALVITIIVLLILAGVAISMLSGENGILRKAAEAKTKTEEKSMEEQIKLAIMGSMDGNGSKIDKEKIAEELGINKNDINGNAKDIIVKKDGKTFNVKNGEVKEVEEIKEIDNVFDDYFQSKGSNYKCRYGMITGIRTERGEDRNNLMIKDTVDNVNSALPEGYKVAETDGSAKVTTGMKVVKETDESEVAKIVVFGDLNLDNIINDTDANVVASYVQNLQRTAELFELNAMNAYDDGELNGNDVKELAECSVGNLDNDQNRYAESKSSLKRNYKKMQELIGKVQNKTSYKIVYNEEEDTYKLTGVKQGTTVAKLKEDFTGVEEFYNIYGTPPVKPATDTDNVTSKHKLRLNFKYTFEYIWVDEDGTKYPVSEDNDFRIDIDIEVE